MKKMLLLMTLGLLFAQAAYGQFNIQKFEPTPFAQDFITAQSAEVNGHMKFTGFFMLNYARDPLLFAREGENAVEQSVINHLLGGDILLAMSFWDFLEAGIDMPIFFYIGGESGTDVVTVNEVQSFSLGDLRLTTKLSFIKPKGKGLGLAAGVDVTFPTASEDSYVGEGFLTVVPKLMLDYTMKDLRLGLNLGWRIRENNKLGFFEAGDDLIVKAAVSYALIPKQLVAIGEYSINTEVAAPFSEKNTLYMEGDLALKFFSKSGLFFMAGAGSGFAEGYGTPKFRVFAGLGFAPLEKDGPKDRDKDGLMDNEDQCPDDPEDFDGFQDSDGCPDPDNDGDKILDVDDKCPNDPEDIDKFEDLNGCPDPDNDKDGILDVDDKCPNDPEDKDNFEDEDGCPDPDNDNDKILDVDDKCPDNPETYNEIDDEDGCPDEKAEAIIVKKKIIITQKVYFKKGTTVILKKSFPILKSVVKLMKEHPEIKKVSVDGHASTESNEGFDNLKLSERRANKVMQYLVTNGIDKKRLTWKGYGSTKPIVFPDDTEAKREKNRRIEFNIIKMDK